MLPDKDALLTHAQEAAKKAGSAIMVFYRTPDKITYSKKSDKTPLTDADIQAHDTIKQHLEQYNSDIPILSEEESLPGIEKRRSWKYYWLVDPLDGTKEFINQTDEFVVSIALIKDHNPVIGVIYHPVSRLLYYAMEKRGAFCQTQQHTKPLNVRQWPEDETIIFCSRHHKLNQKAVKQLPGNVQFRPLGSALKFCYLAEGRGDVYPGFGLTSEWDAAAGHCILEAAGGIVRNAKGKEFRYNEKPSLRTRPFWAVGDKKLLDYILAQKTNDGRE